MTSHLIPDTPVLNLGRRPAREHGRGALALATEFALVAMIYLAYRAGRLLTADSVAAAEGNADFVRNVERLLHLPSEAAIQASVNATPLLEAANVYYVCVHFPATIAFLVWGYLARPRAEYRWARNLLVVQTMTALVIHVVFPLAPPQMFPEWGFIDTMLVLGPSVYEGTRADVANEYAAMPSLHVGWAVLIAVVVSHTGARPLGRVARMHAVTTVVVVTLTANHWFVDGAVAVALLGIALALFPAPGRTCLPKLVHRSAVAA